MGEPIDKVRLFYGLEYQRMWGLAHRGPRSDVLRDTILSIWSDTQSVIDLGCSAGALLESFHRLGIEIWGVDIDPSILDLCCVPVEFLEIHDLEEPYYPPRKFDVCVCADVLEHIRVEYVDIVIESMARCSDRLYMNIPSQIGGAGHCNMRPIKEWQRDFERHGFERIIDLPDIIAGWNDALIMRRRI
jgi:SAM-dependent methyltransferase